MPKLTATEWDALKKDLIDTFNALYQTKDGCNMKKESYVRKDLCSEIIKNTDEKMNRIDETLASQNKLLTNHMEHFSVNMITMKTEINVMKSNVEDILSIIKDSKKEKKPTEHIWGKIILALIGVLVISLYIIKDVIPYLVKQ